MNYKIISDIVQDIHSLKPINLLTKENLIEFGKIVKDNLLKLKDTELNDLIQIICDVIEKFSKLFNDYELKSKMKEENESLNQEVKKLKDINKSNIKKANANKKTHNIKIESLKNKIRDLQLNNVQFRQKNKQQEFVLKELSNQLENIQTEYINLEEFSSNIKKELKKYKEFYQNKNKEIQHLKSDQEANICNKNITAKGKSKIPIPILDLSKIKNPQL